MAENRSAPPNPVTPDAIHQLATGFMAAKHLFVANEVGLFEKLALGPANLDRLAELTGIAQPRVRILADALVALGMIERQDDRYQNGPAAAAFLSGQGPGDLCPYLRFFNQISYPQWANLEETIRTGHVQENTGRSPEQQRIVSQGVEANQAPQANALPTAYDFAGHQRMLDLGGGTGSWLAALLRHCDHLTGTVFDLPDVAGIARERLAGELRTQRAQVMYGD
ncbi:MAG: SAM-dependent methyltransferase, partial [Dehalococcoidia bacterium]|nr:SAM-dependent methyltransferase [Dehalococcoidia bacterium]